MPGISQFKGNVFGVMIVKLVLISLKSQLIDMIVDNIYVLVGNKVFRQCIVIPMGTDCAPLLANLYFFSFEYKGLLKNKAKFFSNTFRYIDDLLTINNPSFEK